MPGRAHLVGIAGSGMRSLAEVLLGWGWEVSGSDASAYGLAQLAGMNLRLCQGHASHHLPGRPDVVVVSDAIPADNPELTAAQALGVPVLSYFQAVGQIMAGRSGIAIAGTHGKSTTTAMLAHLLVAAGQDPTVIFGATPLGQSGGGRAGRGPLMLAEACEYRANFLHLQPRQAAILGIEPDHFDCYPSWDSLHSAFAQYAKKVPDDGLILARSECLASRQIAAGLRCRVLTFGLDSEADWAARELCQHQGRYSFSLWRRDMRLGSVELAVPGVHNVTNALAAAALAWENGVDPQQIAAGLAAFRGLCRRMETVGCWRGVRLLDDYAHHPTEVAAALAAVRAMHPGRRVWCVFQPHQASRTARLLNELAASLGDADRRIVAEIYRAREPEPRPGEVTAADLAQAARRLGSDVLDEHAHAAIVARLRADLRPGDVLITMGAGDIRKILDDLPQEPE